MSNKAAVDLIKQFEGCILKAYYCPAGRLTLGWGHTKNIEKGDVITQDEADDLLNHDVEMIANQINILVRIKLNNNQLGALVSFAYNVGITALRNSTLLQKLNNGDVVGAGSEFLKWNKATVNGKKVVLAGLTKRRAAERALFLM